MKILAGALLGWTLGANDAANVFGTAVHSQMVRWRTAAILLAVFALLGALLEGGAGLDTYGKLADQDLHSAFLVSLAAAITVLVMTLFRLPISTSQAVVGAIIGSGLALGNDINLHSLKKVVACWIGTPIGAAILAIIFYPLLARLVRRLNPHFLAYDYVMRLLLIAAGIYGAYALGANNVANATGVFYKAGAFGDNPAAAKFMALLIGGGSIGLGALTFSRRVMATVGKGIITLDAFSAFVAVACHAAVVHIYALAGVPVSTSQALVGAVLGIGVLKGIRTVSGWTIARIFVGWIATPAIGLATAYLLFQIS